MFAIVGVSAAQVRAAAPSDVASSELKALTEIALSTLRARPPRVLCSQGKFDFGPVPIGLVRPFGPKVPVVLVTFDGRLPSGQAVDSGPVVAVTGKRADVPWGSLTNPAPRGFYVNGKPYLWAGESGEDCGARNDRIYAVEGNSIRLVHETGFLAD